VRGAFTGAVGDRRGAFEEAHGGTLFLDEIGELPLDLQPKLLRALENREVRRVGETRGRSVDVRVIAATNRNLAAEVNRGTFREDLYFRLAVVEVHVPPLRARREDIPLLVERFVRMLAPSSELPSPEIMRAFSARAWPGNVRELRNAVERALALSGGRSGTPSATASAQETAGMHPSLDELLDVPYKEALDRWTQLFERRWLEHTLEKSGGSVSGAAKLAEVSRKHVQRLMKRYGIGRTDGSDS
jgi:transcriptional regulator with GAF, ATPase, and Fis domain